jgi:CrcB protein
LGGIVTQHRERPAEAPVVEAARDTPSARPSQWAAVRSAAALYAAVALGTMIGGVLRALASLAVTAQLGHVLPWGTLFVNVTGSFLIGLYATLTGPEGRLFAGPKQRQFVMTGICGGYTTFSIFSLETLRLLQDGKPDMAAANVAVSVVTWLAAVWLGHRVAMRLNRLKGS